MTTIVGDWRHGILVADSQFSGEGTGLKYQADKVFKVRDGWLGGAGNWAEINSALQYLRGGCVGTPPGIENCELILLTPQGCATAEGDFQWEPVDQFTAIGTGAMAAETLLRHGYSALEAVRGACSVDLYSGGEIKTYRVRKQATSKRKTKNDANTDHSRQ